VAALYDAQLSFYFSSIFMIIFWEVRRKDFAAMFTHHIVTVALLAASARLSFWRAGAAVMALHDACDVLMEAAKCFNYLGADGPATAAFAAFIVAWAVLRLGIYPLGIVRSAVRDLPAALGGRPPMWWGFVAGLGALLVLHIYWFGLIARVAWMRVSTGGGRDVREDDD
jgi:ceramide synthetase